MHYTVLTLSGFALPVIFFNVTTTTESYTLSLHDALPIFIVGSAGTNRFIAGAGADTFVAGTGTDTFVVGKGDGPATDRKCKPLNYNDEQNSYAVNGFSEVKAAMAQSGNDVVLNLGSGATI